ncbi:MAG: 50S ribosomal protein L29 [Planctomycetota bacterium]
MAIADIRGKDSRELHLDLQALQKEYFELKFKGATEVVAKTARFRQIRRERARILTVLGERRRQEAKV